MFAETKPQVVLVFSERPVFREGLKRLVEEAGLGTVITASDEESTKSRMAEVAPDVIVIDRPEARADELTYFLLRENEQAKVVVYGWNDNKLAIYSCRHALPATLENLIKVIREQLTVI